MRPGRAAAEVMAVAAAILAEAVTSAVAVILAAAILAGLTLAELALAGLTWVARTSAAGHISAAADLRSPDLRQGRVPVLDALSLSVPAGQQIAALDEPPQLAEVKIQLLPARWAVVRDHARYETR
jgi:hypothetical protein